MRVGESFERDRLVRIELSDAGIRCRSKLSDDLCTPTDKVILARFFSCDIVEFFDKDFSIFLLG